MRGLTSSVFLLTSIALVLLTGCSSDSASVRTELPESSVDASLIAVVDGGISDEQEVAERVAGRWSAPRLIGTPRTAHANQMAGLVLGLAQPGYNPDSRVRILDVRVLDRNGLGKPEDIAEGVRWAMAQEPEFMLLSMSLTSDNPQLREAIKEAVSSGVTVVASTANGIGEPRAYPAEYPGVVGVTSATKDGRLAPLAGIRGANVAALGYQVKIPQDGQYVEVSGTSVAAAIATRVLATCVSSKERSADGAVRYAHTSGEQVITDRTRLPVLRCPQKKD